MDTTVLFSRVSSQGSARTFCMSDFDGKKNEEFNNQGYENCSQFQHSNIRCEMSRLWVTEQFYSLHLLLLILLYCFGFCFIEFYFWVITHPIVSSGILCTPLVFLGPCLALPPNNFTLPCPLLCETAPFIIFLRQPPFWWKITAFCQSIDMYWARREGRATKSVKHISGWMFWHFWLGDPPTLNW